MLNLRNINPMVRAVGTMGAVSALVGGITFAQLTSNTVALSPNTLSTGSANLQIAATTNNRGDTSNSSDTSDTTTGTGNNAPTTNAPGTFNSTMCSNATNGSIPGFNLTGSNGLLPGVTSSPLGFCLKNASSVPLDLTVVIPNDPFSSVSTTSGLKPSDVTLHIACTNGGNATGTLDQYVSTNTTTAMTLGSLAANHSTNCQATVQLSNSATITGTQTLPSFDIEFTGTTSS